VRRHAKQELERLKKDAAIGEDEERGAESVLQKLTDKHVEEVDDNLRRKEAELSEV
jgi:ribosome recycling factor